MYATLIPMSKTGIFTIKIYTLVKSDTVEDLRFRIGGIELNKGLRINRKELAYEWKIASRVLKIEVL
ncbi:hypothetical protein CNR22_02835 [Sphingobacteriaceae bacterium]|nr:hypothetical protein CNR22_02835 [Sphingobacteriaceae bacterium]